MAKRDYKAPKDPRGAHMRVYCDVFDSAAWACLSGCGRDAYLALLRQKGSTNNGNLALTIKVARRFGIKSEATLVKALRELLALGLIAVTRKGGCTKGGQKIATLYRFTEHESSAFPLKSIEASKATNDWRAITTVAAGAAAIARIEAEAAEQERARKTKRALQKFAETPSEIEDVLAETSSEIEVWSGKPLQKLKPVERRQMPEIAELAMS